ncbi:Fic family protein [Nakamurella silvestris]|nr:Fic family protein [Nakamurella silvestris]
MSEPTAVVPWPALTWEPQTWEAPAEYGATRRERTAGRAYRSAIAAEIAGLPLALPGWLAAELDDATQQIVRFVAEDAHQIGGLTAVLIRSESASSSQIEQITASARAIAEAEITGRGSGNAAVIAANVTAMSAALADDAPLDGERIVNVQRTLLADHAPHLVGWRTGPVWIGSGSSTPATADYVAPDHTRIGESIDDLVRFIQRDDLPILAQAAIAHAQFETIHPFADGNGRTGRALVQMILRRKEMTRSSAIPISGGLLVDKRGYFDALTAYRAGDAAPIISAFSAASSRAVHQGTALAEHITEITGGWRSIVKARSDSAVWKVLEVLPATPVADAAMLASATGRDARNIHRALRQLTEVGILVENRHHKSRRILFRTPEILAALDEYAERFGRRES